MTKTWGVFRKSFMALVMMALTVPMIASAADLVFTAKIFDPGSSKQKVLFTYKNETEMKNGIRVSTSTYSDPDGKVVARETMEFVKEGDIETLKSYRMEQLQLATDGRVEIGGGKANFSYTKDGKTKTSEEKVGSDFIVGPTITSYLEKHWGEIVAGKSVNTRFGVLDRRESVGFEYFKEKETELDGKKVVVVKMKPSSFVIAALVDPLHFFFTPDGKTLVEVHGRTQVKKMVDGKYKDLDAVTVYDFAPAKPAAAAPTGNSK